MKSIRSFLVFFVIMFFLIPQFSNAQTVSTKDISKLNSVESLRALLMQLQSQIDAIKKTKYTQVNPYALPNVSVSNLGSSNSSADYVFSIVYPKNGAEFNRNSSFQVKWTTTKPQKFIAVVYNQNGGMVAQSEILGGGNSYNGLYKWKNPTFLNTKGTYLLKLVAVDGANWSTYNKVLSSTVKFDVVSVSGTTQNSTDSDEGESFTMKFPNGGETLKLNQTYNIRWGFANVNSWVYLKLKDEQGNTSSLSVGSDAMDNSSPYPWKVPANLTPGRYKIGVFSGNGTASDYSDDFFNIVQ